MCLGQMLQDTATSVSGCNLLFGLLFAVFWSTIGLFGLQLVCLGLFFGPISFLMVGTRGEQGDNGGTRGPVHEVSTLRWMVAIISLSMFVFFV